MTFSGTTTIQNVVEEIPHELITWKFDSLIFRDGPLFFYQGVPILVRQHTIFLVIQQLQTIFSLFLFVRTNFLTRKFMNFYTKDSFHVLIEDHSLAF